MSLNQSLQLEKKGMFPLARFVPCSHIIRPESGSNMVLLNSFVTRRRTFASRADTLENSE